MLLRMKSPPFASQDTGTLKTPVAPSTDTRDVGPVADSQYCTKEPGTAARDGTSGCVTHIAVICAGVRPSAR
eukprot:COSAG06_NODE_1038_length_10996_cov_6.017803_8_plen_72_part_00